MQCSAFYYVMVLLLFGFFTREISFTFRFSVPDSGE